MKAPLVIGFLISIGWVSAQSTAYDYIPDASYEQIADRLSCIENEVPLNFNERVKGFVDYFTVRDRGYTKEILNRKDYFFDIFSASLAKYNLPDELKYLAIVESGLRPNAVSYANAVGLWQFISSTGKMYGLKADWYVDDRMDPIKATDAACRHLIDLHRMFGNWELALAAYNCGPGNVNKAIRRSGYKRKFWEIYNYLPRETRSYVPQFVAVMYTMEYAEEHNLYADKIYALPRFDTVMVSQYFHIETFAKQTNLCLDELLALNPSIMRGALPEGTINFALKVPENKKAEIVANRAKLYDNASKVGKAELDYLARNMPGSTYGRVKQIYRVQSGDVLGSIAQRYGVRLTDLKTWNSLTTNTIMIGQRLNIWVLPTYSSQTKDIYSTTPSTTSSSAASLPTDPSQKSIYQVRQGDTLWSISVAQNIPIEKLKQMNNLQSNTIHAGQALIIGAN